MSSIVRATPAVPSAPERSNALSKPRARTTTDFLSSAWSTMTSGCWDSRARKALSSIACGATRLGST